MDNLHLRSGQHIYLLLSQEQAYSLSVARMMVYVLMCSTFLILPRLVFGRHLEEVLYQEISPRFGSGGVASYHTDWRVDC